MDNEPEAGQEPFETPEFLPPESSEGATQQWPLPGQSASPSTPIQQTQSGQAYGGHPTNPPARPPARRNWTPLIIVLCVVLVLGIIGVIVVPRLMSGGQPEPPAPVPTLSDQPSTPVPAPTLPPVVDLPPVTEAIDIPAEPILGDSWEATDGNPAAEHLQAQFLVSPCGIFVTMLTTNPAERDSLTEDQRGLGSRILGFDIDSGKQLWSQDLRQITGQGDPALYNDPSYTPSCRMVISTVDMLPQPQSLFLVSLSINLYTGDNAMLSTGDRAYCQAATDGWAGCYGETPEQGSWAVNLDDPSSPNWHEASDTDTYSAYGDVVAAGRIWTPEGYRDPATDTVDFGMDTQLGGDTEFGAAYVEPYTPGGYRSGVVVRLGGGLGSNLNTCDIMRWDTTGQDTGLWPEGQSTPCGGVHTFVVAGGALLITYQSDPQYTATTSAYALSDGTFLWQREGTLWPTLFDRAYTGADKVMGISQSYAIFTTSGKADDIVRISDGADVRNPAIGTPILAQTMAYEATMVPGGPFYFLAYQLDPGNPDAQPDQVWSLHISDQTQRVWTFATNGTMYLVYGNGSMSVAPLLVT